MRTALEITAAVGVPVVLLLILLLTGERKDT